MNKLFVLFMLMFFYAPVLAAPAGSPNTQTSPNPRPVRFVAQPGFNKEACCKCWNDLYVNGADWQVPRRPRPCDGDCVCDWCGTNNANATYGTPCAGAGEPGAWGYCVANCQAPPGSSATPPISIIKTLPSTSVATPPTSIIKTLPPTTISSNIIKTLPPTTGWTETSTFKSHEHTKTSIIKTLPPTTFSTHTHPSTSIKPPPPPLKEIRQDPTLTYATETSIPYTINTDSSSTDHPTITSPTDTTLFFGSGPSDTISLSPPPTTTWTGGTTIEGSGTLTFSGGTETFTYGSDTITLTFPPAPILTLSPRVEEEEEVMTKFPPQSSRSGSWTTGTNLPVETSWYNGGPGFSLTFPPRSATASPMAKIQNEEGKRKSLSLTSHGRTWTTDSVLPVETSWYGGGPGFSLTFTKRDEKLHGQKTNEVKKRQTWGSSTLSAITIYGSNTATDTFTIPGETITFGFPPEGPGMSLTIGASDPVITARPEVVEEKRQVGVIITGGPWTEDNGQTFTDYWGLPGEVVTLLGPYGDETLTLSGTPRHITAVEAKVTGI